MSSEGWGGDLIYSELRNPFTRVPYCRTGGNGTRHGAKEQGLDGQDPRKQSGRTKGCRESPLAMAGINPRMLQPLAHAESITFVKRADPFHPLVPGRFSSGDIE